MSHFTHFFFRRLVIKTSFQKKNETVFCIINTFLNSYMRKQIYGNRHYSKTRYHANSKATVTWWNDTSQVYTERTMAGVLFHSFALYGEGGNKQGDCRPPLPPSAAVRHHRTSPFPYPSEIKNYNPLTFLTSALRNGDSNFVIGTGNDEASIVRLWRILTDLSKLVSLEGLTYSVCSSTELD